MTKEELKEHCERQIQQFERVEKIMPVTQNDWKRYEEHKLILELLEQEPRWIPIVMRKPTDEEKAEYLAQNGEELCYMLENEMPLNGQEVLVSIGKFVSEDVFDEDFYNFENNDIENVDAWMPKPKPYSEVKE